VTFRCRGFSGVAVRIVGYPECSCGFYDDNPDEWSECVCATDRVYVTMVGDDARHLVDESDLTPILASEYCSCCGQIGCDWGAESD
jgi:hypothetical protein